MADDKKSDAAPKKWAVVTQHSWLPSRSEQIARARAWGADVDGDALKAGGEAALIEDDVREVGRTTNWPGKLQARARFHDQMKERHPTGDQVFFATPLCVGFTVNHAKQTLQDLWDAGMLVYVHSTDALYRQGDDMTEFLASVQRQAKAGYQKNYYKHQKSE